MFTQIGVTQLLISQARDIETQIRQKIQIGFELDPFQLKNALKG